MAYKAESLVNSDNFYGGIDNRTLVLGNLTVTQLTNGIISVFDTSGRETAYFTWQKNVLRCISGKDSRDNRLAAVIFIDQLNLAGY
jgi:hypothetical protein